MKTNRNIAPLLTSLDQNHITPPEIYDPLYRAFNFQLDPCTTADNPLGTKYFITKESDGLAAIWQFDAFVNPPYREAKAWVLKGLDQHRINGITVCLLLANRTETEAAQLYAFPHAKAVCFLRRRISFLNAKTKKPQGSPTFGSMIVILKKRQLTKPQVITLKGLGYTFFQ